jgi:hypothetical protein
MLIRLKEYQEAGLAGLLFRAHANIIPISDAICIYPCRTASTNRRVWVLVEIGPRLLLANARSRSQPDVSVPL